MPYTPKNPGQSYKVGPDPDHKGRTKELPVDKAGKDAPKKPATGKPEAAPKAG